jgi:hypothetical protein
MKTKSVLSRLKTFEVARIEQTKYRAYGRYSLMRFVDIIDQGGVAVCLPIIVDVDGVERVVYSPKTINGLIDFLEVI